MAHVLLVEDEADVRQVMQHALFDGGHEVDIASGEADGRKLLAGHDYDLLIADARLPDGSGIGLAEAARQKGIAALVITGYAFNLPKDELERFEVLLKPVRPGELLQAVERVLHREKA